MSYIELYHSGELLQRISEAYRRLSACDICPHNCGINRIKGETGFCGAQLKPKIASTNIHRGEEPPISGSRGSGTIFFSGCSLKCKFCQNFPISQFNNGNEISTKELATKMLKLQHRQVHNINFVTPTHFIPQILAALYLAIPEGFNLPILWNTSGYEKIESLKLLDGIVSIYLPDMKYSDDNFANTLSAATCYVSSNREAVIEMNRQVGTLVINDEGIAEKGVIIRHLVLPNGYAGTAETLKWIVKNLGSETYISMMSQYFPANKVFDNQTMSRAINQEEYDAALEILEELGLENGWVQELKEERSAV